ncbi:MAG: hypothetical protein A2Y62_07645 [Candidatus Fischerbacteria bacterium RBG_13_37_8]|uniref:O-methyltransferase C-terminal domain-containing protein n=1 Tax=Candidatus Fischerbacteria bacterium RBG_13_37_8 TaxID=1817863 RepID=A0A1F5VIU4_9BACT|nr:MAG: hypothetical protein A2Y62_07645 [Candidatus Fischerbacteria bacterium RBG_13_37_8]
MKLSTSEDILELLEASVASTALGAAIELGLFWMLDAHPMNVQEISSAIGIPLRRCSYWLQILQALDLIELDSACYKLSSTAQMAILKVYSQDTWALLAAESRERMPVFIHLAHTIKHPGSVKEASGLSFYSYYALMEKDPERARRFTRMLFELHQPLAQDIAKFLDLSNVKQLMDIGGGSGVISMALLQRYPDLHATVVEIPNVCTAGRELAAGQSIENRITFHPANFLQDALPRGFDLILECDVNIYGKELFFKIKNSLNPNGRFIIIDQFAPEQGIAPPDRVHWAFEKSMINPEFMFATAQEICTLLEDAGFQILTLTPLPIITDSRDGLQEKFFFIETRGRG